MTVANKWRYFPLSFIFKSVSLLYANRPQGQYFYPRLADLVLNLVLSVAVQSFWWYFMLHFWFSLSFKTHKKMEFCINYSIAICIVSRHSKWVMGRPMGMYWNWTHHLFPVFWWYPEGIQILIWNMYHINYLKEWQWWCYTGTAPHAFCLLFLALSKHEFKCM